MANRLVQHALDIRKFLKMANRRNLFNDSAKRYEYQKLALDELEAFEDLLDIAFEGFEFEKRIADLWEDDIYQTRKHVEGWINEDKKRLRALANN